MPTVLEPAVISMVKRVGVAHALTRYQVDDALEDSFLELAAVLDFPLADVRTLVDRTLEWYHYKRNDYPEGVDRALSDLVIHVTQPFRIPFMTERMNWVVRELASVPRATTLLDYGGGGGKDSILFARLGWQTTYADLFGLLTPYVKRRFEVRGLNVAMVDVRDLGERRFDAINCMDVIEHIYDVEHAVADIFAHLWDGGHLLVFPCFHNSWDGDHVEKNCGYRPYFRQMLDRIGLQFVSRLGEGPLGEVYHFVRRRPGMGSVSEERALVRSELYFLSEQFSLESALRAIPAIGADLNEEAVSTVIDNLAIRRLSRHRLVELGYRNA